ncbi:MAG TPA: hypothetical protein VFJ30_10985 [Phycisphaerae bacterium]|nr:hypothetical protein [Phycisphaerae bacterium]
MAHHAERPTPPLLTGPEHAPVRPPARAPIRVTCRRVQPDPFLLGTYLSVNACTPDTVPSLFLNVLV